MCQLCQLNCQVSDDDYMEEWEEWIAVENGHGPRATTFVTVIPDKCCIRYANCIQ